MSLGKALAEIFPAIINIKRTSKNFIIINFKFSFDANQFIQLFKYIAQKLDCLYLQL